MRTAHGVCLGWAGSNPRDLTLGIELLGSNSFCLVVGVMGRGEAWAAVSVVRACVGAALFWRKGPFTHGQAERREGPYATKAGVTFSPPEASPQAHVVTGRSIPLAYVKLRVCRGRVIGNRGGAA